MLWLSLFAPTRVDAGCESWCVVAQCSELNGPVQAECGACDSNAKCWPGASDYPAADDTVFKVAVGNSAAVRQQQQHVADPMASANIASNVAARPCKRIDAAELDGLGADELADALDEPTIVTGLIDSWPSSSWLLDMHFDNADPTKLSADAQEAREDARQSLYQRLQRDYAAPQALRRASAWRVLSYGEGPSGVHITPNHGFAWLGLLNGTKVWHLAPSTVRVPDEFGCERAHGPKCSAQWEECMVRASGTTRVCRHGTHEVVIVPTGWWHSTCNGGDAEATVGIGGQDRCDTINDGEPGCALLIPSQQQLLNQQGVPSVCPDPARVAKCYGPFGIDWDAKTAPRLLLPDLQLVRASNRAGHGLVGGARGRLREV